MFRYRVGIPGPDYQPQGGRPFLGFWWFVGYGTGLDRKTAQLVVYARSAEAVMEHWPTAFIISMEDSSVGLWRSRAKRVCKETSR